MAEVTHLTHTGEWTFSAAAFHEKFRYRTRSRRHQKPGKHMFS